MHNTGTGCVQNDKEAAEWWGKAAEQGERDAQYELGKAYGEGRGINHSSWRKMEEWMKKAAEQDHVEAQYDLGGRYAKGAGVRQCHDKALKWSLKAAKHGHMMAHTLQM